MKFRAPTISTLIITFFVSAFGSRAHAQTTYSWNLDSAATWDTLTSNWLSGVTPAAWANGANTAVFGNVITVNRAVAVATGGITAGNITFSNTGAFAYTVGTASNTITLNNGASNATISVGRGFVGTSVLSGVGGNTITGSNITFFNSLVLNNDGAFGTTALTIAGNIDRNAAGGSITVGGQGNTTITGIIGSTITGGIIKNGLGTLNLSGVNTFTGTIAINAGVVSMASNDTSLGNVNNGITLSGGVLRLISTVSLATTRVLTVSGTSGLDLNSAVTGTFAGTNQITGSNSSVLNVSLTGGTTAGILSITGPNSTFSGSINVGTPGVLVGSVFSQRLMTTSDGPTLQLSTSGTLSGATSVTFNNSSVLRITQPASPAVAITGRLGTTPLTFNNGRIVYNPSTTAPITDTFGPVSATGLFVLTGGTAGNAGGTTLNFGALTRVDNATIMLRSATTAGAGAIGDGTNAGVKYLFSNLTDVGGSGTARNVIPWAAAVGGTTSTDYTGLVTYDADGFRKIRTTELQVVTTALSAGVNNNLQGTAAVSGATSVISIVNSTATPALTGTAADVLTITSGAVANFNSFSITGPTLNFPNGAYFHLGFPISINGTSTIQGSSGVTTTSIGISTSYMLTLAHTNPNTFTGGLFVLGNSKVSFVRNNQLGNDGAALAAGDITLGGGQLIFQGTTAQTLSDGAANRVIKVNASNGTIAISSTATFGLTIPGAITGTGQMQFGGSAATASTTQVIELTNPSANSYSGGTVISAGLLRISNSNQLGTGAVYLNGGQLQASANLTFATAPSVIASSTINTQANDISFNAGLNGSGGIAGTTATTLAITKTGAGNLIIGGMSNYAGTITLGANTGTLTISGTGAMPEVGAISIGLNGALNVNDSATPIANRLGRTTNITLTNGGVTGGASMTITKNAAGTSLSMGTLTVSGGTATNPNTSTLNILDDASGNNTIRFLSLTAIAANNTLNIVGTLNFGSGASGSKLLFATAPSLTAGVIANVLFTGSDLAGGFVTGVPATYDPVFGVVAFLQSTGSFIDNISSVGPGSITPTSNNFLTNANTTANVGATIKSLAIAGNLVTLVPSMYTPVAGNANAPADSLVLTNAILASQTAASTITTGTAATIRFGSSSNLAANISTTTDLIVDAGVTLLTSGGLSKTGAGALTINGTNSITGPYSLAGGTTTVVTATAASLSGAGALTVTTGPLTLNGTAGSIVTYSGILTVAGLATTAGFANVQTLSGANALTGTLTINGGTIVVGSAGALGTISSTTVGSGGTLAFGGATVTNTSPVSIAGVGAAGQAGAISNTTGTSVFAGPISLTADATIGASAGSLTLSGGIGGSGIPSFNVLTGATVTLTTVALTLGTNNINMSGGGTLVLPNFANTLGNVNATGGVVSVTADNNLGATTNSFNLSGGGGFQFNAAFALAATRTFNLGAGGGTINTNGFNATVASTITGLGGLIKAGTGILTVSGNNNYSGGTTIANGTLQLGSTAAATAVTSGSLTFGSGTTSGILDLNGFSPASPVTAFAIAGTGTGHQIINSNTSTVSTVTVNLPAGGSIPMSIGGNVTFNKNDAFALTLTGTVQPAAVGVTTININAGSFTVTTATPLSNGAAFGVASAGTLNFGAFGANNSDLAAFGVITSTGGAVIVASGSGDLASKGVSFTGGSLDIAGTSNFWWHFRVAGAAINIFTSPTTVNFTGPTTGSRIQNDTAAALPINVDAGTSPSGIDLNLAIQMSSAGTNANYQKNGTGLMQVSFPGTVTGAFTVAAGTMQVASGTTLSGATTINGGIVRGTGILSAATAVNTTAYIQGGTVATPLGTLTSSANVTVSTGGGIQTIVADPGQTGTAVASLINVTGATAIFNLIAPFNISVLLDSTVGNQLLTSTNYTANLVTVATAGNIQLNGVSLAASTVIDPSNYTLLGVGAGADPVLSIDALGQSLVLSFIYNLSTGSFIDNLNNVGAGSITPSGNSFLTNANTTANLGATVKALTIAGHTVTLVPGVYTPGVPNVNAPTNTLVLTNGLLTSTTGNSLITTATTATVRFGATGTSVANITTTTNLTFNSGVTVTTTGGLLKSGAGTLTVNGTNNITGAYQLSGGATTLLSAASVDSLAGSGNLTVNGAGGLNLVGTASVSTTYSGNLTAAGITTAAGFNNVQTFTGSNTLAGNVTINGGTIVVGNATALGAPTTTVSVASGGTLAFNSIVIPTAYAVSIAGVGASGQAGAISNTGGSSSFAGPITLTAAATIGASAGSLTLSGGISGAGIVSFNVSTGATVVLSGVALNLGTNALNKNGAGTLVLPEFSNVLGNLNVNGGIVTVMSDNNLGSTTNTANLYTGSALSLGSATTLNVNRTINLDSGSATINVNGFNVTINSAIIGAGGLIKTGTGALILAGANTYAGGTNIAVGTLQLGSAGAAAALFSGPVVFGSATNTTGTVDLNGFSSATTVTTVGVLGTSTSHQIINSNAVTLSTVSFNPSANSTAPLSIGGNITFNKEGGNSLTLSGTVQPATVGTTTINVNGGTFSVASATPLSLVTVFTVATGASLNFGAFGNNNTDAGAFGTISSTGGSVIVASGSGDLANKGLTFTGGSFNISGTTNFWWHMRNAGAAINVLSSSSTVTFTGPTSGSRIQNDTAAPLPVNVAAGTDPSGIDLNVGLLLSSAGTNANYQKNGNGLMQLSFAGTNTGSFIVTAGTLQIASATTNSGTFTVNGGVLRGTGTMSAATTVNATGYIQGGSTDTPAGTLISSSNVTITTNGGIQAYVADPGQTLTAIASKINLTGATSIFNINPGPGNTFTISILPDATLGNQLVPANNYTITLVSVATAGNIQLNGVTQPASTVIDPSNYILLGVAPGTAPVLSVDGSGQNLMLTFTPVPEPTTILGLSAGALLLYRRIRRNRK